MNINTEEMYAEEFNKVIVDFIEDKYLAQGYPLCFILFKEDINMSLIPFTNIPELQNTRKGLFIDLFTTNMFLLSGCIHPLPPFKEDF